MFRKRDVDEVVELKPVLCSKIFEREFGVTLNNRSKWPGSQNLNHFAVHGDVCEYAPKDMHKLHQQTRISIGLDESATRNIGSNLAYRHSVIDSRLDLHAFPIDET
jgi:hypothetical protein